VVVTETGLMTQRLARPCHRGPMPSPSLLAAGNTTRRNRTRGCLVAVGPAIALRGGLLKIANDEFTNWKHTVAPMAPLVSGGRAISR